MSKYSKREAKDFNGIRIFGQWLVCEFIFGWYVKIMYNYSIEGNENIPRGSRFIIAANHISGRDPFILPFALRMPIAFMAKEELFEKFFSRFTMDFCGAFAVRRDKVEVSTIKTALAVKDTKWMLGLFPQGTRDASQRVEKITRGFATFAKAAKCGILPVAILGSDIKPVWFRQTKLTVKVGELIPYSDDIERMMQQWCETISELTGKEYVLE